MVKVTTKKGLSHIFDSCVIFPEYKRCADTSLKTNKLVLQKSKNWFWIIGNDVYDLMVDGSGLVYTIPERLKNGFELVSEKQLTGRYYIASSVRDNDGVLAPDGIKSFHSSEIQSIEFQESVEALEAKAVRAMPFLASEDDLNVIQATI